MSTTTGITRRNIWLLFTFAWISWLIALAGLSSLQSGCGSYGYNRYMAGAGTLPGPGPRQCPTTNYLACQPICQDFMCTFYSGSVSCSRFFSYQWWQVWLQFFVMIWLMLTLLFNKYTTSRPATLALLTITTLQMLDFTGTFGNVINANGVTNGPGASGTRADVTFAGGLLLSMFNFLLIICIGYHDKDDDPGNNWAVQQIAAEPGTETEGAPAAGTANRSAELTPVKSKPVDDDDSSSGENNAPNTPEM